MPFNGVPHRAHERRRVDLPFYEVVLRAFPHGPGSEVLVGKAREEHYGDIGAGLVHCSECIKARGVREHEVKEHEVELF